MNILETYDGSIGVTDDTSIGMNHYQNHPGLLYVFYEKLKPMFGPHFDGSVFDLLLYEDE
jgi:hypothetical protein